MIAAARDALRAGDVRVALDRLLAAWRETPAIALANAIEDLGAFAARGVHPPTGVTDEDREANWIAEARTNNPVTRHRLVETVVDTQYIERRMARLAALVACETDPRVANLLVAFATSSRMPHKKQFSTVWNPLFLMLARCGDPRVCTAISRAPWDDILSRYTNNQRTAFRTRVTTYQAKLDEVYPDPPPALDPADVAILDEIVAIASAPPATDERDRETEAALVAAVYATPGDLGPRAIYADWLLERGLPRGEFISLQLAHTGEVPYAIRVRTDELLAQHRTAWIGELAPFVRYDRWRGGFPDDITLTHVDARPHPAWSTVRHIANGIPATDEFPMPILETATEIGERGILALDALTTPPPLVHLGWRSGGAGDELAVAAIARLLPRVPTLRQLTLRGPGAERLGFVWRGSSIRHLDLEVTADRIGHWLEAATAGIDTIVLKHEGWTTTLSANGELVARQGYSGNFEIVLPHFETAFARVAVAAKLTKVTITVYAKHEWKLPERRRMASILIRNPRWAPTAAIYGYTPPK